MAGAVGAVAAAVYGYPGFPVMYVAVCAAAWAATPPALTGRKDPTGQIHPVDEKETKDQDRFRWLKTLQTAMLLPGPTWLPYQRPVIVVGAALALLASAMPAPDWRWMVANMVCAYLLVPVVAGAKKDVTGSPGVSWQAVKDTAKGSLIGAGVAGAVLAGAVSVAFRIGLRTGPVNPDVQLWWLPAWLIAGAVALMAKPVSSTGLAHWREILEARKEWSPRWLGMKVEPQPLVTDTVKVGPARVDTIAVTAASGSAEKMFKLAPQVAQWVAPNSDQYVVVLSCPIEQNGQLVPGTVDGSKVQVVSWPLDAWPEDGVGGELGDDDAAGVMARLQWAQVLTRGKVEPPPVHVGSRFVGKARLDTFRCPPGRSPGEYPAIIAKAGSIVATQSVLPFGADLSPSDIDFTVVSWPPGSAPDLYDGEVDAGVRDLYIQCALADTCTDLLLPYFKVGQVTRLTDAESPAVWQIEGAGPWSALHANGGVGMLGGRLNAVTLIDTRFNNRAGALFAGAIGADVTYTERIERKDPAEHLKAVHEIDMFHTIMSETSKMGASIPILQPSATRTADLPNGTTLTYRVHMIYAGLDPLEFATSAGEKKFGSAVGTSPIGAPSLATIMPFLQNGRDRHTGAFVSLIASGAIYPSMDAMPPEAPAQARRGRPGMSERPDRSGRPGRSMRPGNVQAQTWLAQAMLNKAFDAAKMPRVDIQRLRALTTSEAPRHIWEAEVRLYGVTVASVRTRTEQFAQALSVPYFRVRSSREGYATFYIGADPAVITDPSTMLVKPDTDVALLSSLSWEYGFLAAKVTGAGGALPSVVKAEPMASNPKIIETTVTLPAGLSKGDISGAVTKLRPATGFAFIDVRATDDPATLVLLSCEGDPMPFPAKFDYQAAIEAGPKTTPFAVGTDGGAINLDPEDSAHTLILGLSGSGKASPDSQTMPVPVQKRFPNGQALHGDLRVGDLVWGADGKPTEVIKVHEPVDDHPLYRITFDDGRSVVVGENHLWLASTNETRALQVPTMLNKREAWRDGYLKRAADLRELAARTPVGTVGTIEDVMRLSGAARGTLYNLGAKELVHHVPLPHGKKTRVFDAFAVADQLEQALRRGHHFPAWATRFAAIGELRTAAKDMDGWMTARDIIEVVLGRPSTRKERESAGGWVRQQGFDSRTDGTASWACPVVPVAELLVRVAGFYEQRAYTSVNGTPCPPLESVVSVKEMLRRGLTEKHRGANRWAVRMSDAVDGPKVELPLSPYVLGVWLGDGTARAGTITIGDQDRDAMLHNLNAEFGYEPYREEPMRYSWGKPDPSACPNGHNNWGPRKARRGAPERYCITCTAKGAERDQSNASFARRLSKLGLIQNKHIPETYMSASFEQRLALFQGLMDTDGSSDENGSCELTLCDERLVNDALQLARSLGFKASMTSGPSAITYPDGTRKVVGTRWRIHFTTSLQVFRLPRKMALLPKATRKTSEWLYITDISPVPLERARCISVASPDARYLIGDYVPTHNSIAVQVLLSSVLGKPEDEAHLFVVDPTKEGADFMLLEPWVHGSAYNMREAAALMRAVYAENKKRMADNVVYEKAKAEAITAGLPAPEKPKRPRLFLVVDEFTSLILPESVSRTAFDDPEMEADRQKQLANNALRSEVGELVGRFAREARAADISLILATQKLLATDLEKIPGGKSLRAQMSRILLGKSSYGDRQSALRAADEAADLGEFVPKGRGLYETNSFNAKPIQVWYDSTENLLRFIESRRPRVTERLDFSAFDKAPKDTGPAVQEIVLDDLSDEIVEETVVDDIDFGDIDLDDLLSDLDDETDGGASLDDLLNEPEPPSASDDDLLGELDLDRDDDELDLVPVIEPVLVDDGMPASDFDWDDEDLDPEPVPSLEEDAPAQPGIDVPGPDTQDDESVAAAPETSKPVSDFDWDDEPNAAPSAELGDSNEERSEEPWWNRGKPATEVSFDADEF